MGHAVVFIVSQWTGSNTREPEIGTEVRSGVCILNVHWSKLSPQILTVSKCSNYCGLSKQVIERSIRQGRKRFKVPCNGVGSYDRPFADEIEIYSRRKSHAPKTVFEKGSESQKSCIKFNEWPDKEVKNNFYFPPAGSHDKCSFNKYGA